MSKFIRVGRWEQCQYNWYSLIMRYALKKIQIMKIRCKKTFIWYQNLTYDIIILVRSHAKSKSGGVGCVSLGRPGRKWRPSDLISMKLLVANHEKTKWKTEDNTGENDHHYLQLSIIWLIRLKLAQNMKLLVANH